MKVLIACEESGTVREAFNELGHDAWSCDLLTTSIPGNHIQDDVLYHLNGGWDLMIAHPPCTYLSHAGARWLYPKKGMGLNQERYKKGLLAKEFFMKLWHSKIPKKAIENPYPSPIYKLPEPTQIIQPYEYGHRLQKKTLLWLKDLPLLMSTKKVDCEWYFDKKGIRHTKLNGWSSKRKSKTFSGIAKAMAEQWGSQTV